MEVGGLNAKKSVIKEKIDLHEHISDGIMIGSLSSEVDI